MKDDFLQTMNIRELKSIIRSSVNLSQGGLISANLLPENVRKQRSKQLRAEVSESEPVLPLSEIEKSYILKIYNRMDKNKSQTAKLIGIGLNTLRRKLNAYGVE